MFVVYKMIALRPLFRGLHRHRRAVCRRSELCGETYEGVANSGLKTYPQAQS